MVRKKCPNKCENETDCPCDEIECVRHGICCECVRYHREHPEDGKPACMC